MWNGPLIWPSLGWAVSLRPSTTSWVQSHRLKPIPPRRYQAFALPTVGGGPAPVGRKPRRAGNVARFVTRSAPGLSRCVEWAPDLAFLGWAISLQPSTTSWVQSQRLKPIPPRRYQAFALPTVGGGPAPVGRKPRRAGNVAMFVTRSAPGLSRCVEWALIWPSLGGPSVFSHRQHLG